MGSSLSNLDSRELVEFRKQNTTIENVEIPAIPEARVVTDKKGFVFLAIGILVLLPLLIYTLTQSTGAYPADDCANFCSICSRKSYIKNQYSVYQKCLDACSSGVYDPDDICVNSLEVVFSWPSEDEKGEVVRVNVGDNFSKIWWKYILSTIITIALSVAVLTMLRFFPACLVWTMISITIVFLLLLVIGLWVGYVQYTNSPNVKEDAKPILMIVISIITIQVLIFAIILCVLFKRIRLMIQLYREATKVLAARPWIFTLPIITTIIEIIIITLWSITTTQMGYVQELVVEFGVPYYTLTGLATFSILLNTFIAIWLLKCVSAIYYMTVAGTVACWYFAKNKNYLGSPICRSFVVAVKKHFGTAAFGTFLIMLFSPIKALGRFISRLCCCNCFAILCCSPLCVLCKFFSETPFVQTAMHGQSFIRSAKRTVKLLLRNAKSIIAINCVGDFVLFLIGASVVILATIISYFILANEEPVILALGILICLIINVIVVTITFATFQIIINSLLICFCEDSVLNDGISRPYYMSKGLMEFVENSKKFYEKSRK